MPNDSYNSTSETTGAYIYDYKKREWVPAPSHIPGMPSEAEEAMEEASRCLNCKNAKCVQGCPVSINIAGFISKIKEGDKRAGQLNFYDLLDTSSYGIIK